MADEHAIATMGHEVSQPDGGRVYDEIIEYGREHGTSVSCEKSKELAHNSLFGRGYLRGSSRALSSSWSSNEFMKPEAAPWSLHVSSSDLARLINGCVPEDMSNKFFIYADGPDVDGNIVVHFHNSWIGNELVRLHLVTQGDARDTIEGWSADITRISWEIDKEKALVRTPNFAMAKFIALEACRWVLGIDLVDDIEEPPEWPGVSYLETPIKPVTSQGPTTLYQGGAIRRTYMQEIQGILAEGSKDLEVNFE
jgi:hypothetical protein